MQIERRLPQYSVEPQKPQDKKLQSSFEQSWTAFMQEVIAKDFFVRPHGARLEVWFRQKDIIMSRFKGESIEGISQKYRKPVDWVKAQLRCGTERVYKNSPDWLREKHPKETILPNRAERMIQRRVERESTLAVQLQREDLNKEELRELMAKVGYRFYKRHKDLFVTALWLARDVGFKRPSSEGLDLIVDVLEREGGVVVTTCHSGEIKIPIFLKQDYEAARETLESSKDLSHLVK